jgi:hypothetical protein
MGFLRTLLFAGLLLPLSAFTATPETRPNIVFILADDLGTDWLGCYGSSHPTPNVDRLAANGVRFETAWTSPICTPTRVMMLTGQYPGRTGWTEHYDVPRWGASPRNFRRGRSTCAELVTLPPSPASGRSTISARSPISLPATASNDTACGPA